MAVQQSTVRRLFVIIGYGAVTTITIYMLLRNGSVSSNDKDGSVSSPARRNGSVTSLARQNSSVTSPARRNGSVTSPARDRQNSSITLPAQNVSSPSPGCFAVLFTTFSDNPKKQQLFANAIRNWATFLPAIQPLLFSTNNKSALNGLAEQYGWRVIPGTKLNKFHVPFLKHMYLKAYDIEKNASFYGFCNGDILFDGGLMRTLTKLRSELPRLNTTMIAGKRRDYSPEVHCRQGNVTVWRQEDVQRLGRPCKLDLPDTEDYFITTRDFPWNKIADVVIGRVAYDNYLVGRSRQLKITTIDITNTITALHQCGGLQDRNTTHIAAEDLTFNNQAIGEYNYEMGLTCGMRYETVLSETNDVAIFKRKFD